MTTNLVANPAFTMQPTMAPQQVTVKGETVTFQAADLHAYLQVQVFSIEFLTAIATQGKPFIRSFAAEHEGTPPEILTWLLYDNSPLVFYAAMDNPSTPFLQALNRYLQIEPDKPIYLSAPAVNRREDYLQMLTEHGLSEKDSESLPNSWIVALIKV